LLARPAETGKEGAVWFLYERNNQHQAIAEAVAPAFFGIRIECAQCHDHMMVDEIRQEHYWGLVAFFNRGENKQTPNGPRVVESAVGGFSEFANLSGDSSPNLLTFVGLEDPIDEPRPGKDEKQADTDKLYVSTATDDEPRVPKFSRREKFVEEVLSDHPLLARAMVNRVWAIMMGRGIVHPYDEIDSMHPPSHPALLDALTEDFAANGFDIRRLVRSIALSDAYQLSSVRPKSVNDPATFAYYLERPLTAEQFARSIQVVVRPNASDETPIVGHLRQQFKDVLPDQIEVPISDALFLSNDSRLDRFLRESTGKDQWIGQLLSLPSHRERAATLIRVAFTRDGEADEIASITDYLASRDDDLPSALVQTTWALLTSAEFRFNH
jgi:hypothetical protein